MTSLVTARTDKNALYLIDSSIYIFRAWHNTASVNDASGQPANATHGFIDFLYQLISRRNPRLIACAFDECRNQSTRHRIFPAYKANRRPTPENLKSQFASCKSFVQAAGIAAFASDKVEADDIIGTLTNSARQAGLSSVIVSADKDLCQFVGAHDAIWDYARDTWLDARLIEKRFGVRPHQIPDLLALTGDKVDNIPGVPGVGIATAARLLIKWGNLETLLDNTGKVRQMKFRGAIHVAGLLSEHRDTIMLARRLTGLHADNTNPTEHCQALTIKPDIPALQANFDQLGFTPDLQARWRKLLRC